MFAMQGFGIFLAGAFVIAVSTIFRVTFKAPSDAVDPIGSTVPEADYVWRIILMFGYVPVALTYYWRMKMPETARYTALIMKNQKQAAAYMYKVLNVDLEPEMQEVGKQERTWFLLDIAYYSQNMFQKDIFTAVRWLPPAASMNALDELFNTVKAQSIIALCGTVPGYWFLVLNLKGSLWRKFQGKGKLRSKQQIWTAK